MNLYNIYDSESGVCLAEGKTSDNLAETFNVPKGGIYRSAMRGHILNGKYRVSICDSGVREKIDTRKLEKMKEWDDTVRPLRIYFHRLREGMEVKNG